MKLSISSGSELKLMRPLVLGIAGLLLLSPVPASAQLSRVGGAISAYAPAGAVRGTDTAYDPVNDVYLLILGYGAVYGIFVNPSGQPVTYPFTIFDGAAGFASFPRVEYSPHVSNGAGGQGGFLVAWHQGNSAPNYIYARIVAFAAPGGLVSAPQMISDGQQSGSFWEGWPAIAYSPTSLRFLVAWNTLEKGIQGRFVDTNGLPIGSVMPFENPGCSRDPSLAWNSATNEFGLVYSAWGANSAWVAFRRIGAADGFLSPRTSFGYAAQTFATAIDVNAANRYVMAWTLGPGTMSAVFDQNGVQISTNFVTGRMGYNQSLGLAFGATTGTFLTVSSDSGTLDIGAIEMNINGEPLPGYQVVTDGAKLGSYYPLTAARTGTNQWDIVYSLDMRALANQVVASGSNGAVTPTPPPTSPPPASSTCSTPDPFVAIGGGTCVNGGWLPPGAGGSPPPASACPAPQPGTGWTCVNGGWVPPGTSPPPASTCTAPQPGTGWTCVNGGWVPPGAP